MKKASCMAFLAGCFPIALIEMLHVFIFDSDEAVFVVQCFAVLYMAVSIWACIDTELFFRRQFQSVRIPCKISGLQRKDLFSSGAISYYVIPFISFIGSGIESAVTLLIVTGLMLAMFRNNIMFLYTPLLDVFGYKILEGDINRHDGDSRKGTFIVKTDNNLFFSSDNQGKMMQITNGVFFFVKDGV